MTDKNLAEQSRKALEEFRGLPLEEQERRLIGWGSINESGEVLMDPLLYRTCRASVEMGLALRGMANPFGQIPVTLGEALHELQPVLDELTEKLGIRGDTPEDQIKSLTFKGGPRWRRDLVSKIIKGLALAQEKNQKAVALDLLGQALWEYQDAFAGKSPLDGEIKNVWPTRPIAQGSQEKM